MKKQKASPYKSALIIVTCAALFTLSGALAFPSTVSAIDQSSVTVILVRHAEKAVVPPENKDPDLSAAGLARAEELRKMFGETGIAAIYATQFKRTQQTVKPLAEKLGLTATQVEAKNTAEVVKQIRARGAGDVVFVAGHNNTVPEIIAALGGPKLPIIPETDYDNLFILTVHGDGSAKLLKLKYSSPGKAGAVGRSSRQEQSAGAVGTLRLTQWESSRLSVMRSVPPRGSGWVPDVAFTRRVG